MTIQFSGYAPAIHFSARKPVAPSPAVDYTNITWKDALEELELCESATRNLQSPKRSPEGRERLATVKAILNQAPAEIFGRMHRWIEINECGWSSAMELSLAGAARLANADAKAAFKKYSDMSDEDVQSNTDFLAPSETAQAAPAIPAETLAAATIVQTKRRSPGANFANITWPQAKAALDACIEASRDIEPYSTPEAKRTTNKVKAILKYCPPDVFGKLYSSIVSDECVWPTSGTLQEVAFKRAGTDPAAAAANDKYFSMDPEEWDQPAGTPAKAKKEVAGPPPYPPELQEYAENISLEDAKRELDHCVEVTTDLEPFDATREAKKALTRMEAITELAPPAVFAYIYRQYEEGACNWPPVDQLLFPLATKRYENDPAAKAALDSMIAAEDGTASAAPPVEPEVTPPAAEPAPAAPKSPPAASESEADDHPKHPLEEIFGLFEAILNPDKKPASAPAKKPAADPFADMLGAFGEALDLVDEIFKPKK